MKKRKTILILSIGLIITLLFLTTYTTENKQEKNYQIAYYMNNKKIDKMPKNNEGATFEHGECDNDASVTWDYYRWGPIFKNLTKKKTKCSLYFIDDFATNIIKCSSNGIDLATCMKDNASLDPVNLANDNNDDNNLRYIGANPNNYIDIGDRDSEGNPILWRIIGVMNNITNLDNGGQQESLIKIIRAESIGGYSWDSSTTDANLGLGINEWSEADLMKLLNPNSVYSGTPEIGGSLYWDSGSGNCYSGSKTVYTPCDFTSSGISEEAKNKIVKVRWNTGTFATNDNTQWKAKTTYEAERGSHNGKEHCESESGRFCNDTVPRTTTWDGYIGLIYPSDFGYAVGERVRETCLGKSMRVYNSDSCGTDNWLKSSSGHLWTLTPEPYPSRAHNVIVVRSNDYIEGSNAYETEEVQPVVYLSPKVKIIDGNGTIEKPYVFELVS